MRTGTLFHESIQVAEDLYYRVPQRKFSEYIILSFYIIACGYPVPGTVYLAK